MTSARETTKQWLITAALSAVGAGGIWSAGLIFAGSNALYLEAHTIARVELEPLISTVAASDSLNAALDRVMDHARARGDTVSRRAARHLNGAPLSKLAKDSFDLESYHMWRAAGRDSAEVAALAIVGRCDADQKMLQVSLTLLAREREFWEWSATQVKWPTTDGERSRTERYDDPYARYEVAGLGFVRAARRHGEYLLAEHARRAAIAVRYREAFSDANRKLMIALLCVPVAGWGIGRLIVFARIGQLPESVVRTAGEE